MTDTGLWERKPIANQDPTPELKVELAEEAAKLLGYAKLKKTLAAEKGIGELASVLNRLDIQPLSRESVERYKAEEPDAAELSDAPEFFRRHRKLARIFLWLIPVWGVLSVIGIAAGWLISWQLGVVSLASILLLLTKGCEFDDSLAAMFPTWERVPLPEYQDDVPLHVLEKAIAIKKQLAAAEFYVEQRAKDPFLIVKCDEDEYYVEVWQEARFEGAPECTLRT
jgi:hypothetical protein